MRTGLKNFDFYRRRAEQIDQLPDDLKDQLSKGFLKKNGIARTGLKKRSKYNNKKTEAAGWTFDSKLEADFYQHLLTLKQAGKVSLILRQVPLHLAPGSKLIVDFLVRYTDDPALYFFDTKGYWTANARTKVKLAEHLYGIEIGIVRRGDF